MKTPQELLIITERLKNHQLYHQLTARQQRFCLAFIAADGDRITAAKAVFKCRNEKSADELALRVLRLAHVRDLMSEVYGYDLSRMPLARSEFLELVGSRLREGKVNDRVWAELAKIYVDAKGWTFKKRPKPEPKPAKPKVTTEIIVVEQLVPPAVSEIDQIMAIEARRGQHGDDDGQQHPAGQATGDEEDQGA